ncbi:MAG: outer membrane beta-barrel protein [Gammaproteobacteria bacterium]|nr:outer membrane beta-barrel protein [Gammaproteobacteria bacterium]
MKTRIAIAFVAVLFAIVAFSLAPHPANAQEYVGQRYFGVNIGQAKAGYASCDEGPTLTWTNCPDKDIGIKLYAGHNLHKNFAVEAGFIDFGEFKPRLAVSGGRRIDRGLIKISGKSLFIAGMGKVHVHPKANLFGKIGLHRWDIETGIEWEEPGRWPPQPDVDDDGVDLFYGIGGEVAPFSNEKVKLRVEYEMFTADDFNNSGSDIDFEFISVGVIYAF